MPSKGILGLIDSDMVDDSQFQNENTVDSIETNIASPDAAKKKGGRPKGSKNRVTKPRTTSKKPRTTSKPSSKSQAKPTSKRKVLEDKTNEQNPRETGTTEATGSANAEKPVQSQPESEDELDSPKTVSADIRNQETVSGHQKKPLAGVKKRKPISNEAQYTSPSTARQGNVPFEGAKKRSATSSSVPAAKRAKVNARPQEKLEKSATERSEQSQSIENGEFRDGPLNQPSPRHMVKDTHRLVSRAGTESLARRRAGSASDTERAGGDPNLRRKLGDITRKFENVDSKYRNLKEAGVQEANANVERLRKQCEATTQASNELIAALKKELATQTSLAQGSRKQQRELQERDTELTSLRSSIGEMSNNLSVAQNEIRSLQAKLAASRSASAHAESVPSKTPASVMKHQAQPRTVITGSAEAAQAVQTAQLKEDLYSDLTGLIIRGVKKTEDGDLYDCIQTGRNGTLHFKLAVEEGDGKATSFEDAEFLYTPFLDKNRDRDLLAILPDYLTEEITFSREHAAKFYSRVVDALTKRRSDE